MTTKENNNMQRLEDKIDSLRELLEEKIDHIACGLDKIESVNVRTTSLENWRNFLLGGWAVISVAVVIFYSMLPSLMDSLFLDRLAQPLIRKEVVSIVSDEFFSTNK